MSGEKPHILTVDDESFIRSSIKNYLEDYDYTVSEASDGLQALEIITGNIPDIMLLDLRMPGMSGLEVLNRVNRDYPQLPVIVISGTGNMRDAIDSLRLGAWDYIMKPIHDMSVLKHRIEKALERAVLVAENQRYREHLEELVRQRTEELQRTNRELEETRLQIIIRLAKAAEYKDFETGRHVIRVGRYSEIIARGLGLDEDTVNLIALASPMHDLGKIGIPDRILLKADRLDLEDWEFMKYHVNIGSDMLEPIPSDVLSLYHRHSSIGADIIGEADSAMLRMARSIALNHHERWDGTGYTRGLSGDHIPIEARIVALADVFDALASKRPYKDPFPVDLCLKIVQDESGHMFDPEVVNVFIKQLDLVHQVREEWNDDGVIFDV